MCTIQRNDRPVSIFQPLWYHSRLIPKFFSSPLLLRTPSLWLAFIIDLVLGLDHHFIINLDLIFSHVIPWECQKPLKQLLSPIPHSILNFFFYWKSYSENYNFKIESVQFHDIAPISQNILEKQKDNELHIGQLISTNWWSLAWDLGCRKFNGWCSGYCTLFSLKSVRPISY